MSNVALPESVDAFFTGSQQADPDAWSSALTEDVVLHDPVGQPPIVGRAAVRERMAGFLPYFSSFQGLSAVDAYPAGDSVAVLWEAAATKTTGEQLAWSGINVFELGPDGRITRMHGYFDPSVFD